jgi:hypothetical protein
VPPPPPEVRVCEGANISLLEAASDPSCVAAGREWAAAAEAGAPKLAQEATRDGDGVVFAIVNRGTTTVRVPLRYSKPELAFSVLAESKAPRGVFELAPPTLVVDAGAPTHVQSAIIVLPPGGRASVRLSIDRRIVGRLDRRCDGGDCMPAALAGPAVFHIGQTLTPLGAGPPARVEVD